MADVSHILEGIDDSLRAGRGVGGLLREARTRTSQEDPSPWRAQYEEWATSRGGLSINPFLQTDQDMDSRDDQPNKRAAFEMRNLVMAGPSEAMKDLRAEIANTISGQDTQWELLDYAKRTSMAEEPSGAPLRSVARRIIAPLKFVDFSTREAAVAQSILETYSWIFNCPQQPTGNETTWSNFPDWLERSEDPVYWITGKPGAGKSTIMKFILGTTMLKTHLAKWAGETPLLVVRYYAWHAGTTPQKTLRGLKQSLLYQVLDQYPDLIPVLAPRRWAYFWLFNPERVGEQTVTESEVDEYFDRLMAISGKTVSLAVFIDGLDEFDVSPSEVVALVESIATSSRNGIKLCVASRPWVEFEDAYAESPKLQMDLHTGSDMEIFTAERFRRCRAFRGLSAAHPTESMNLQRDLTLKANGVFIWLRLVVDSLEQAATEGSGMLELQEITESLPTDMSALYDFIWGSVPKRNRQRGATLIQAVEVANFTMDWAFAWLLDEYAPRRHDLSPTHLHLVEEGKSGRERQQFDHLLSSLKRKLASRTRCILVESNGCVDFTHRTARDWAVQSKVWDRLQQDSGEFFDPNLLLLEGFTVQLTSKSLFKFATDSDLWSDNIMQALECASRVSDSTAENIDFLVHALDTLDTRVPGALCWANLKRSRHWSCYFAPKTLGRNTFLHLTAQFAVLPYLKAKAKTHRHIFFQPPSKHHTSIGVLQGAIFGYKFHYLHSSPQRFAWLLGDVGDIGVIGDIGSTATVKFRLREQDYGDFCVTRRLDTIQFLLDIGVDQFKMLVVTGDPHLRHGGTMWQLMSLRDIVRYEATESTLRRPETDRYFRDVARMLGNDSLKTGAKLAMMWARSRSTGET